MKKKKFTVNIPSLRGCCLHLHNHSRRRNPEETGVSRRCKACEVPNSNRYVAL